MTFVVGVMCADGMVICTDSLESDGFTKKSVGKIRVFGTTEWQVAMAGAGAGGVIDKFCDEVSADVPTGPYDLKGIESTIEKCLQDFNLRYPQDDFQVVVGVHCLRALSTRLYRTEGGALAPKRDLTHTGTGHELWRFLTAMLYEHGNSVQDNQRLAIFATRQAIEYLEGVDEPIQLAVHNFGTKFWEFKTSEEISGIEREINNNEFRKTIQSYWRAHNPPSHREQVRKYKGVRTPGDELTSLEGVKLEELQTISGRTRALKIFDRNRDKIQKCANLERDRISGQKGN